MAHPEDALITKLTVKDIILLDGGTITIGSVVFTRNGDVLLLTAPVINPDEQGGVYTADRVVKISDGSGTGTD